MLLVDAAVPAARLSAFWMMRSSAGCRPPLLSDAYVSSMREQRWSGRWDAAIHNRLTGKLVCKLVTGQPCPY